MEVLIIFAMIIWVVVRAANRANRAKHAQQDRRPRSREEAVAEQRRRAEAYRAAQQGGAAAPERPYAEQPRANTPRRPSAQPEKRKARPDIRAASLDEGSAAPRPQPTAAPATAPATVYAPLYSHDKLIDGIVMAEVLGPCRAKQRFGR